MNAFADYALQASGITSTASRGLSMIPTLSRGRYQPPVPEKTVAIKMNVSQAVKAAFGQLAAERQAVVGGPPSYGGTLASLLDLHRDMQSSATSTPAVGRRGQGPVAGAAEDPDEESDGEDFLHAHPHRRAQFLRTPYGVVPNTQEITAPRPPRPSVGSVTPPPIHRAFLFGTHPTGESADDYAVQTEQAGTMRPDDQGFDFDDGDSFYETEAAELDQTDATKLYLPLSKETWERYSSFCQKACPLWTRKSHNDRIAVILKMAEKYYTRITSPANAAAPLQGHDHLKTAVYDVQSTPQRATVPTDTCPPSTPAKSAIGPKTLERTPRQDDEVTIVDEVRHQASRNLQSCFEVEKCSDTDARPDHDAASVTTITGQGPRVLGVTVGQSSQNNLTIFFQPSTNIQHQNQRNGPSAAPSTPQGATDPYDQPGPEKRHLQQSDDINPRQDCDTRRILFMPRGRASEGGGGLVSNSTAHVAAMRHRQMQICGVRHPISIPTRPVKILRSIEFTMPPNFHRKYTNFFARHGWAAKSAVGKLRILLEIVNRRLEITARQNTTIRSRRAVIDNAISNLGVGPNEEECVDAVGEPGYMSGPPKIKLLVNHRLSKRYDSFFTIPQYTINDDSERFKVLLGLAELYLDLGLSDEDVGDSNCIKGTSILGASVLGLWPKFNEPGIEPFVLWLSPEAKKRFTEFFKRINKASESDETKIITLLNVFEWNINQMKGSTSSEGNCVAAKYRRGRYGRKIPVVSYDDDDDDDSDGTWDDGTKPAKRAGEPEQSLAGSDSIPVEPKSGENTAVRLLKQDYFLKFSQEARNTRPAGSKRSVAAMANTRRHIVERRKLKQLIAHCACVQDHCSQKIDRKSIKIKEHMWVVLVDAHCLDEAKHKFQWASSQKITHFTKARSHLYTLNMAAVAAVDISGNSHSKMSHFAKTLRLSWGHSQTSTWFSQIARPVARKCFEMTQEEMLQTLKEEGKSGQIVLAGDGQFDSPGSCATTCTYTLMALGVDQTKEDGSHQLRKCGYVINQAVIDRRHAENKPVNMERVGLHWALQPIIKAGIKVAELVTDDHIQIVTDFRKIAAAAEEEKANAENDDDEDAALTTFQQSLSTALQHFHPKVDLDARIGSLLSFYSAIIHSNDIWHRAKNVLKTVSSIAQTATSKEQQSYRKYAKMLRNYLWECAEAAKGHQEKFLELWTAVRDHLHDDHTACDAMDLHSRTKSMGKLDQTTRPFARLIACMRRVEAAAPQLCRFRNTGHLESFNGLTLKYCPKRTFLTYDSMVMRRDLAALDHNHNVLRGLKRNKRDGQVARAKVRWRKSTKTRRTFIEKEEKDYEYIGHLMAAMLLERCQTDRAHGSKAISAAHPWRIHRSLQLAFQHQKQLTANQQANGKGGKTKTNPKTPAQRTKKQCGSSSGSDVTPADSDSDDYEWESDGFGDDDEEIRTTKPRKRKAIISSDDEASPDVGESASKRSKQTAVIPRPVETSGTKPVSERDPTQPAWLSGLDWVKNARPMSDTESIEDQGAETEIPQSVSSRLLACEDVDQDWDSDSDSDGLGVYL